MDLCGACLESAAAAVGYAHTGHGGASLHWSGVELSCYLGLSAALSWVGCLYGQDDTAPAGSMPICSRASHAIRPLPHLTHDASEQPRLHLFSVFHPHLGSSTWELLNFMGSLGLLSDL
jgi:hypothetical protein